MSVRGFVARSLKCVGGLALLLMVGCSNGKLNVETQRLSAS